MEVVPTAPLSGLAPLLLTLCLQLLVLAVLAGRISLDVPPKEKALCEMQFAAFLSRDEGVLVCGRLCLLGIANCLPVGWRLSGTNPFCC